MRYIVVAICVGLMAVRAVWPEVRFDNISLTLLIIAAVVVLLPELREALEGVKKVKIGKFEFEIVEKLKALASDTEKVESSVAKQDLQPIVLEPSYSNVEAWLAAAATNPRASLVLLAIEIEKTIRDLATAAKIPEAKRPLLTRHIGILAKRGVIDERIVPLFRDFWAIRNSVVHGQHFELSEGKLYELLELGLRIVRLLRASASSSPKET